MKLLPAALLSTALYGATVDVPDWVRQAAAQTVPQYPAKVFAVSLLQEESVTVDPDGRRVMRERGVVKTPCKLGATADDTVRPQSTAHCNGLVVLHPAPVSR